MKLIKWNDEIAKRKAEEFITLFTNHQRLHETRCRENEAVYRSDFNKSWSAKTRVMAAESGYVLRNDKNFKDFLVKADMNHTFSFARYLHSTLIANDPIVTASPADNNDKARTAAEGADLCIRYSKDTYGVEEAISSQVLHTLIYGIGNVRVDWDDTLGKIVNEIDPEKGDVLFEGDVKLRVVDFYNYYIISTSTKLSDTYGYVERIFYDIDEAKAMYPEFADKLKVSEGYVQYDPISNKQLRVDNKCAIFEYIEIGRAFNGNMGRRMLFTEHGEVLKLSNNPYMSKCIPCAFFTDIELPNSLYPLGIIDMLRTPQKLINDMMSRVLENVKLYSKITMLVDRGAALSDLALNEDCLMPIEYSGREGEAPRPMTPPQLPAFIFQTYDYLVDMMQHVAAIRSFSRGEMPKAVSGYAANLMVEADNKVQTQVHKRYKASIKTVYEQILERIHENWSDGKLIKVFGKDNTLEVKEFKKSFLDGSYKINIDYGTSLPLDPVGRRQMVEQLISMIKNLGIQVDPNKILQLMKAGDVLGTFDINDAASKVQKMESKIIQEKVEPVNIDYMADDHIIHYNTLNEFFNSGEYQALSEEVKVLLKKHAQDHLDASAMIKQGIKESQYIQMKLQAAQPGMNPSVQDMGNVATPNAEMQQPGVMNQPVAQAPTSQPEGSDISNLPQMG